MSHLMSHKAGCDEAPSEGLRHDLNAEKEPPVDADIASDGSEEREIRDDHAVGAKQENELKDAYAQGTKRKRSPSIEE